MRVVIVTDIFGLCESTDDLIKYLAQRVTDVVIVEPYKGERHDFQKEQEAYNTFIKECGHDKYLALVLKSLSEVNPELLIGFSAGASAVWRASGLDNVECKKTICFYPAQIRSHLDIIPKISTSVIFPHKENTFDVISLSKHISACTKVDSEITPYEHGFMNRCSKAYDPVGEEYGFKCIENHLVFRDVEQSCI
ncbi:dienelactone hydrolase family protein [Shewanella sp. AS16]|uniref:dienelactone hydrolase family protein n=1 Tax=Shewanella sp. AS16 TaxID=2907625 RepID=UPI001F394D81|nr:dienelactone hydrolase family protein [Shewanella sp. AS16]MCE9685040.1 dienelactone hydrolase family protein [Shewanella sp. AS16]